MKPNTSRNTPRTVNGRPRPGTLGLGSVDTIKVFNLVRAGFPFREVARFQKAIQLPGERFVRLISIPQSTLNRRRKTGRLLPDESDRVWRASRIFDLAVELFDGDNRAAREWLLSPQPALGGEIPLDLASTDVGAREVEKLIGRLEHGVAP